MAAVASLHHNSREAQLLLFIFSSMDPTVLRKIWDAGNLWEIENERVVWGEHFIQSTQMKRKFEKRRAIILLFSVYLFFR